MRKSDKKDEIVPRREKEKVLARTKGQELIERTKLESKDFREISLKWNDRLSRVVVEVDIREFVEKELGGRLAHPNIVNELHELMREFYIWYFQGKVGVNVLKFSIRWGRTISVHSNSELDRRMIAKVREVQRDLRGRLDEYVENLLPKEEYVLKWIEELQNISQDWVQIVVPKNVYQTPMKEIVLTLKMSDGTLYKVQRESSKRHRVLTVDYNKTPYYLEIRDNKPQPRPRTEEWFQNKFMDRINNTDE